MSIVFEEVTGSVGPEQPVQQPVQAAEAAEGAGSESAEERADGLRLALVLMTERALRLHAD